MSTLVSGRCWSQAKTLFVARQSDDLVQPLQRRFNVTVHVLDTVNGGSYRRNFPIELVRLRAEFTYRR